MIAELAATGPVVTDGAWGTELQARGLPIGACPDAWNLTHSERVEEVARAYVAAGSRVILTNTFGANRIALKRHNLSGEARRINLEGVAISRRAAYGGACVFGSMGPSGKSLTLGEVTRDLLWTAFAEQAEALAEAGADAIVVETMTDLVDARLAVDAAVHVGPPVIACMAFTAGQNSDATLAGDTPEQAARELADAGASAIGANCGNGAEQMLPVCRRLRAATDLPLWIKPNAGQPRIVDGKAVYMTTPSEFVEYAVALADAGANYIGGCCGTNPAFIAELARALARHEIAVL